MSRSKLVKTLIVGLGLTVGLAGVASADVVTNAIADAPAVNVTVDGKGIDFADGAPYLDRETNRVYVPLRYVSEALRAEVGWKSEIGAAVVKFADRKIEMRANQIVPLVDGSPGPELDAPARLEDGRMMVPLRFVSEALGFAVEWAGEEYTVRIEMPAKAGDKSGSVAVTEWLDQSVTDDMEVKMRIPVISGLPDQTLEKEINAEFMQKAEDFRRKVAEPFAEYKKAAEQTGASVWPFQVVIDYADHYNQNGLLSISVSYYGFQGGAHGFTMKETLNLDVNAGERLTLADFFGPDEDYLDVVIQKIKKEITANPEMYFEDALETVAEITPEQPFYIKDGEIVVYFAQYEIAPGAAGMPEFSIPVSMMPGSADVADKAAIRKLVRDFGGTLQLVSLSAPAEVVRESIQEHYSDYIVPALLSQWQADPKLAPGRLASSPWPDRIEVLSIKKLSGDRYVVQGNIVEITNADKVGEGEGLRRSIALTVRKTGEGWLIDGVTPGEYPNPERIVYHNAEYGFIFSLPESWKGYEIVAREWEGTLLENSGEGDGIAETGPMVLIRHPRWTSAEPRQDIPIMVFAVDQWEALQRGEFSVGAAPVPPRELGQNSEYVFALPARYNFAFPAGYEEVEDILEGEPLRVN
jgi:hypothetical protein